MALHIANATFLAVMAALIISAGSVNAWSQTATTTKTIVERQDSNNNDAIDRRSALQKAIAASSVCIAWPGSVAASASGVTTPSPKINKKVYIPPAGSLDGKVIVITGANSGLGLESAKRLAGSGATIVMTARTEEKGERAISEVQQYLADRSVKNANIYTTTLDLADFDSVRSFPKRYSSLLGRKIDVLVNNAGIAAIPEKQVTKDGFERTFQINHLGPFMLTSLLFPYLNREGSRIINVSSYAHEFSTLARSSTLGLDIDNLNGEIEYSGLGWPAYCRSKLENILFTQELQRRADAAGLDWLTVIALHPGRVATDIWRTTYFGLDQRGEHRNSGDGGSIKSLVSDLFYSSVLPVDQGANTQVMLAASGEKQGVPVKGQYFDEQMKLKRVKDFARDEEKSRKLWEKSQELAEIEFKFD